MKTTATLLFALLLTLPASPLEGASNTPLSEKYLEMIRTSETTGNLDWARAYAERLLQSRRDLEPGILRSLFRICLKSRDFSKCREIITRLTQKKSTSGLASMETALRTAEAADERERILQSEVESEVMSRLRPPPKPPATDAGFDEDPGPPQRPSYGPTIDRLWTLADGNRMEEAAKEWYLEASRNREFISMDDGGLTETLMEHFRTAGNADVSSQYIKGCIEAIAGDPEMAITALRAFLASAVEGDPRASDARGHLSFLASIKVGGTTHQRKDDSKAKLLEVKKKVEILEKKVSTPQQARKHIDYLRNYQKDLRDEIYFLKAEYNNRAIDKNSELDAALEKALSEAGTAEAPEIRAYYDRERKSTIDQLLAERDDAIALSMRRIDAVSSEMYEYEKLLEKLEPASSPRSSESGDKDLDDMHSPFESIEIDD